MYLYLFQLITIDSVYRFYTQLITVASVLD